MNWRRYFDKFFISIITLGIGITLSFIYFSRESIDKYDTWFVRDIFQIFGIYFFVITIFAVVGIFKAHHEFMLPLMIFGVVAAVFTGCSEIHNSFAGKIFHFPLLVYGFIFLGLACMLVTAFHRMYKYIRNVSLNRHLRNLQGIEMARIETNNTVSVPPNHNPRSYADVGGSADGANDSTTAPSENNPPTYEELERTGLFRNN